jgi:quercetin dioxygenase-like cupin family protein
MLEILQPDFEFEDDRGKLVQLVHGDYEQVNVLVSRKGVFRGGHYHKVSSEAFYVISGSVELTAERGGRKITQMFRKGNFFRIEPLVVHSMRFPENCILLALYDRCIELKNGEKDIYSQEKG